MITQAMILAVLAATAGAGDNLPAITERCDVDADFVFDDGRSIVYGGVPSGQDDAVDCLLTALGGEWLVETVRSAAPSWGLVELEVDGSTLLFSAITETQLFLAVHSA